MMIFNLTPCVPLSLRGRVKERGRNNDRGAGAPSRGVLPFFEMTAIRVGGIRGVEIPLYFNAASKKAVILSIYPAGSAT